MSNKLEYVFNEEDFTKHGFELKEETESGWSLNKNVENGFFTILLSKNNQMMLMAITPKNKKYHEYLFDRFLINENSDIDFLLERCVPYQQHKKRLIVF